MNMVDRYLLSYEPQTSCSTTPDAAQDNGYTHDRHHYQLLTVTALYIAIKINEPVAMDPKIFAATSGEIYSVQEIEDMEQTILKGLEWRVYNTLRRRVSKWRNISWHPSIWRRTLPLQINKKKRMLYHCSNSF